MAHRAIMDEEDQLEAEYLARNNRLILKYMSALKKQLFSDEESRPTSQADTTTRSLPVPRTVRSASQGLNRTQPIRQAGPSKDSYTASKEGPSTSSRPFQQTAIPEEATESPRKTNRTPLTSPTKSFIAVPTVTQVEFSSSIHPSLTPSDSVSSTEAALKTEVSRRFGGKIQELVKERSPTRMTSNVEKQKEQSDTVKQHHFGRPVTRKPNPMEALISANETAEPTIHIPPRESHGTSAFPSAPNATTSQPQIRPLNSERIPVRHREVKQAAHRVVPPPEESRAVSLGGNNRIEHNNDRSQAMTMTNTEGPWGQERRRPVNPLFDPTEFPSQHAEQSTWVNESTSNILPLTTISDQFRPNDAVIAPSVDQSDLSILSTRPTDYEDLFADFRRKLAEEDKIKEKDMRSRSASEAKSDLSRAFGANQYSQNHLQGVGNFQSFEDTPRSATSMSRRPILLPPQSKGRKKSESERRSVSVQPVQRVERSINQQLRNFQSTWDSQNESEVNSNQFSQKFSPVCTMQQDEEFPPLNINLASLTSEGLEGKTDEELQQIVNAFYESSPRLKYKETYPYMAEGMVQKDGQTRMLKVFSSRLGRTMFTDARSNTSSDYVYFLVVGPGEYRGFYYDTHPKCLISAKFPSVDRIVVRGYAILAHPNTRSDSLKENRWICWNDSLGLMSIISGSARIPLKKTPVWDKQLDIISIHANFENNKFVVTKVVALTNSGEKKHQFPNEVFLIRDPVYVNTIEDDVVFSSKTLNAKIYIKRALIGEVDFQDGNPFELVVVPTFPKSTTLQFRALLLIHMPSTFWSRDKEWIRELLVKKTEAYRS